MLLLVIGIVVFLGIHLLPTVPDLRRELTARFGTSSYMIVFSLLSILGLALIVVGYGKLQVTPGKNPQLWSPPHWLRHVSSLLMIPAIILLVAAYVPSRIRTAVKHPMLAAITIWAFAHLLANGDAASVLLFGSFLAYAVYDRIAVEARGALGPLGARTGGLSGDLTVIAIGLLVYAGLLLGGHARLFGMPLLPGFA